MSLMYCEINEINKKKKKKQKKKNINTNNGVETQNETFKHTNLNKHHGSSLTGMLSILIEEYFPEQYEG